MPKYLRRSDNGRVFKVRNDIGNLSMKSSSGYDPNNPLSKEKRFTKINKRLPKVVRRTVDIANRTFDESKKTRKMKADKARGEKSILDKRAELAEIDAKQVQDNAEKNKRLRELGLPEQKRGKLTSEIESDYHRDRAVPQQEGKADLTQNKPQEKLKSGAFGNERKTGAIPQEGGGGKMPKEQNEHEATNATLPQKNIFRNQAVFSTDKTQAKPEPTKPKDGKVVKSPIGTNTGTDKTKENVDLQEIPVEKSAVTGKKLEDMRTQTGLQVQKQKEEDNLKKTEDEAQAKLDRANDKKNKAKKKTEDEQNLKNVNEDIQVAEWQLNQKLNEDVRDNSPIQTKTDDYPTIKKIYGEKGFDY